MYVRQIRVQRIVVYFLCKKYLVLLGFPISNSMFC
ncbi:hypothetical protein CFBP1590_0993 [Pseudomonas viridiflava]|uniref:Uncharacterized protein n=1 Tax=Pseudomonas viridiflava TaxID=33069 RepID=A0A1Y6JFL1_PSEVI|nr:hypothetical protein CFBP1590_0993 [Pseudomonas viridiflava]VVN05224.1 hypothetical protein PS634_03517 [Pseudomonas fluorescens]VVO20781.1 hypothetical protein PS689_04210 [Pseudomonas fluorescens]